MIFPWNDENRLLRKALAAYAGDRVLNLVLQKGESALSPRVEEIELTMLFLDIAGFTSLATRLDSSQLLASLIRYYQAVATTVAKARGVLDHFQGDAAAAWWGSDGEVDHAERACVCAKELLETIENLNRKESSLGLLLRPKIGINTGSVMLGVIGCKSRLRYTVLGDQVNLGMRLCGFASSREYSMPVLISGSTKKQLGDDFSPKLVETVRVKGKAQPIEIYSIWSGNSH